MSGPDFSTRGGDVSGTSGGADAAATTLLRLADSDRVRLGEALRLLLDHGSILGGEGPHSDLYQWSYANRPWLEEMGALFDLKLSWENESRLLQAVPNSGVFLLKLKLDATLILLTLWYEFDAAVRDRGETPPVSINAEELNTAIDAKFPSLRNARPSPTRLVEILRLAQRKNLLRFNPGNEPAQTRIEILPTIKRIIPFQDLDDWTRHAARFLNTNSADENEPEN